VRGLRPAAFHLGDEIRQRHGLAELFTTIPGVFGDQRPQALHGAHRVPLRALRRPPRPHFRRRPGAHGLRYCNNGVALRFIPKTGKA
jgi:hypothetical protein